MSVKKTILVKFFIFIVALIIVLSRPLIIHALDLKSEWNYNTEIPLLNGVASSYSFILNDKIYLIGGAGAISLPVGYFSQLNSLGEILNWEELSSTPNIYWHSGANNNKYVYILGGARGLPSILLDEVVYAEIQSNGDITTWNTTQKLPLKLSFGSAFIFDNSVYYVGGSTNGENQASSRNEIYKSTISVDDGSLGEWTLAGTLPVRLQRFSLYVHNDKVAIIGGISNTGITNSVYLGTIDTNGLISSWITQPNLLFPNNRGSLTALNDNLVLIGGYSPSVTNKVVYAPILSNSSIGEWNESDAILPYTNCCSAVSTSGNYIYILGGHNGQNYTRNVLFNSSPTPLPTPIIPIMQVTNLKQYTGGWENDWYDHISGTIKQYGCALTSAVMVLQYHGHSISPDTLNDWLKTQSDGYIRNGLINWLAVSRYTKLNDSSSSPTLEYKRYTPTQENLDNELTNNRPAILKQPGHFVVATGKMHDGIYTINDPGYENRSDLSPYGNYSLAINSYTPTHSDLSYIMFTVDQHINLELLDSHGNPVESQSFIEEPINDLENTSNTSGEVLKVLIFEKPKGSSYTLNVSGASGSYELDSYMYSIDGNVTMNKFSGSLMGGDTDIYNIKFNSKSKVKLSIDGILLNLDNAYKNKLIKNKGIYQSIKMHIKFYQRFHSDNIIKFLIKHIKRLTPRFIDTTYSLNLRQDLTTLIK
ncbi:MAG: C39 family peptidase [bacterium]|nr:MAG: C39 family peptidase [bacterium]